MEIEGTITAIKGDAFWGVFKDGSSFDMPLPVLDGHPVGSTVLLLGHDEDEFENYEDFFSHTFIILGVEHATIIECNRGDSGYEIVSAHRMMKSDFLRKNGRLN